MWHTFIGACQPKEKGPIRTGGQRSGWAGNREHLGGLFVGCLDLCDKPLKAFAMAVNDLLLATMQEPMNARLRNARPARYLGLRKPGVEECLQVAFDHADTIANATPQRNSILQLTDCY